MNPLCEQIARLLSVLQQCWEVLVEVGDSRGSATTRVSHWAESTLTQAHSAVAA